MNGPKDAKWMMKLKKNGAKVVPRILFDKWVANDYIKLFTENKRLVFTFLSASRLVALLGFTFFLAFVDALPQNLSIFSLFAFLLPCLSI